MPLPFNKSFSFHYDKIVQTITTNCKITENFEPSLDPIVLGQNIRLENFKKEENEFLALWDTGATHTVINQVIIDHLKLKPIGMRSVRGAYGGTPVIREEFLICTYLPNGVYFPDHTVTKGEIAGCDILIGMDIIAKGDFAITNTNGRTKFTFRFPSVQEIDFVIDWNIEKAIERDEKYDPCPCGSGKKLKFCHGKTK